GPGRAAEVIAAEGRAIAELRRRGYADAEAAPREVVVDHADRSVRPRFHILAGEPVRLGEVRLTGRTRSGEAFLRRLAPWRPGEVYAPEKLAKLEQRLLDTQDYNGVTVALAPRDQAAGGLRPVLVGVEDRKPRTLELGAGYSTTEGSGVDGKLTLYNRLHRADQLILTLRGYDIQQRLDAELDLPHFMRPDQILKVGGGILGDRTPAYSDLGGGLRLDVERHYTKTTFITLGGAFDYAATKEKTAVNLQATPVGERLHLFILTGLAALALDRSNDPLNPVRGWRLEVRGEPTWITGDRDIVYLKTQAQVSGYLPVARDAGTVIAGRLRLGSILGGSIPDVPADRRFFAGGGGSVRGYGYQLVGPRLSDNTPEGGLSLAEASLEVRQRVAVKWGVVGFVDAGAVGPGPSPSFTGYGLGAGVGVRYDLGFAPLRIDLGTPIRRQHGDSLIQVYISIGQSF
ncbi:MAG: BamA/TamA family outer membrane protein, partial [Caulobacteraceae bacterium]|nr:BamA/TamA family outer membrane protein [Caulobacteraceae bacterium]